RTTGGRVLLLELQSLMTIDMPPRRALLGVILGTSFAIACSSSPESPSPTPPVSGLSFKNLPCSAAGTVQLAVAQTTRVDCTNGGTTVTLAGNGASYLVVAQFAADLVPDAFVPYRLVSGTAVNAGADLASLRARTLGNGTFSSLQSAAQRARSPGA